MATNDEFNTGSIESLAEKISLEIRENFQIPTDERVFLKQAILCSALVLTSFGIAAGYYWLKVHPSFITAWTYILPLSILLCAVITFFYHKRKGLEKYA